MVKSNSIQAFCDIITEFINNSRWILVSIFFTTIAYSVISVASSYVFSRLIDSIGDRGREYDILRLALCYAAMLGGSVVFQQTSRYISFMSSERLKFIASLKFWKKLTLKTDAFFQEHNTAEIQITQERGISAINSVLQTAISAVFPGIIHIALAIVVFGVYLNGTIVLITIIYGSFFVTAAYIANRQTRPFLETAISTSQKNARFAGNVVGLMETLRVFRSTPWIIDRFSLQQTDIMQSWIAFSKRRIAYTLLFGMALTIQVSCTYFLLLPDFHQGTLTIGDLALFNTLILQLNSPFEMLGNTIDDIAQAYSRFLPFAHIWGADEIDNNSSARDFRTAGGQIDFRDVNYRYPNGAQIESVNFVAGRGRINFIVGESGVGKTTIVKLALRSISPSSGEIFIDGANMRDVPKDGWLAMIGAVPQEVILLNDTIKSNIVLGREFDAERLRRAAARASILDRIEKMELQFDTIVGERGIKLSGGERQRIAIARALYSEPSFLFFDEASSALDEATEDEIMTQIRQIVNEVTVIAVTHRRSTIRDTDAVFEVKKSPALRTPQLGLG